MMELTSAMAALLLAMQAQPDPGNDANNQAEAAATPAATEATADAASEPDPDDKMICRRTAVIGSKFKKKICATKKQWQELSDRGSDTTREMQRRKGVEPVG